MAVSLFGVPVCLLMMAWPARAVSALSRRGAHALLAMLLFSQIDALARSYRIADGDASRADTLEELAEMLGIPSGNLVRTVEEYNQMYEQGEDTQFGAVPRMLTQVKTAPFYAVPTYASTLAVCYGVHVNDDSQVCTDDDQPIAGLFAAGNCQGDFFAFNYPVHCPGCSTGHSLVFGQLIGEALAKDTVITDLIASC